MATNQTLKAVIALETRKAVSELKRFTNRLGGIASAVKSAFSIASVAMFGRAVINAGKDFEDAMARVKAVTNATVGEFKVLTNAAIEMGRTTKYTATEAAEALEKLSRNGMKATEAAQALPAVLKLAQANAIDLAKAADILKVSLNMFGLTANNAAKVSDVLSTVAANTATNIEELYDALINVAPAAKVLGFDIEEVSAAIGALAQKGVKGAAAGTQLRIGLIKMVDPKIIKKMQALGIEIDESTMKADGLYKTLKKFADNNVSLEQLTEIFSQKGAVGVQQLVNGLDDMRYVMALIDNQTGTTARMFRDGIGSMKKELDTLRSKWESTMIALFNKTNNPITSIIRLLQNMADMLRNGFGQAMLVIATVTLPLVAKAVTNTIKVFKGLGSAIKSVSAASWANIWTAAAQAVLLAVTAIVGHVQRINKPIKDAEQNLAGLTNESLNTREQLDKLATEMSLLGDTTQNTDAKYNEFIGTLDKIKALFPDLADAIDSAGKKAFESSGWEEFKNRLQEIYDIQEKIILLNRKGDLFEAQKGKASDLIMKGTSGVGAENGWIGGFFRTYLKEENYGRDKIENIFNEITQTIIKFANDTDKAAIEIEKIFTQYGYVNRQWGTERMKPWIEDIKNSNEFKAALQTWNELFKSNEDIFIDKLNIQREIFANEIESLGKDAPDNKIKEAASKYVYNIKSLAKDALNKGYTDIFRGLQNEIEYVINKHKLDKVTQGFNWKDLEGDTNTEKIKKTLNDYKDKLNILDNQQQHNTITAKEYAEQSRELGAETYKTLTGFDDLKWELEHLSPELQAAALSAEIAWNAFKNISQDTKTAAADKTNSNLRDADERRRIQYANFWAKYPYYTSRDTSNDKNMSKSQIAEANLKHTQAYTEEVEKWLKEMQSDPEAWADWFTPGILAVQEMAKALEKLKQNAKDENILLEYERAAEELDEVIKDLSKDLSHAFDDFNKGAGKVGSGFKNLGDSFINLSEAMKEYKGEGFLDDEQIAKWKYYMAVVDAVSDSLKALKSISEGVQIVSELLAKTKLKNSLQTIAASKTETIVEKEAATASMQHAVAAGSSSVAKIPYIGAALAVAAAAAIASAIMSSKSQKFAKGGLVDYGTSSGDNTIARVNKGEMILNKGQQSNLFRMINNGGVGNGEVQFKIQGKDLIGVLRNERLLTSGKL